MKNSYILLLVMIIGVTACDEVTEPYGPVGDRGWNPGFDQTPVYNDTLIEKRRILLEEFTGHKCPNCPEGADIAKQIMSDNPGDFYVVSIHNSGSFSKPDMSNPDHPYPSNFETETGEKLRIKYQFSAFPGGMLNRSEINGGVKVDYQKWEQAVNALLADPAYMKPRFKMYLENTYNNEVGNASLRIGYKVEALENVTGNIAIVAYILESHIIAPQTDNRLSNSYVPDYEHNHVLRMGFPQTGNGKTVLVDPSKGDEVESISDADLLFARLSDGWVPENIEVIVFLYDSNTGEILGVEEMPLVP